MMFFTVILITNIMNIILSFQGIINRTLLKRYGAFLKFWNITMKNHYQRTKNYKHIIIIQDL